MLCLVLAGWSIRAARGLRAGNLHSYVCDGDDIITIIIMIIIIIISSSSITMIIIITLSMGTCCLCGQPQHAPLRMGIPMLVLQVYLSGLPHGIIHTYVYVYIYIYTYIYIYGCHRPTVPTHHPSLSRHELSSKSRADSSRCTWSKNMSVA